MERYSKRLVLASDKSDLKDFAKRQEIIFQLENAKIEAFNLVGPTNDHYIKTSNKLFDLYMEEEDFEEALNIAKEIFDITKSNPNEEIKAEAIVNLGMAYLRHGDIKRAKEISINYVIKEDNTRYPSFCIFLANLNETLNNKDKEIYYLNQAFNSSLKYNYKIEEISNMLLANALYFENDSLYKEAYSIYINIFNNAKGLISTMTAEERFSFLMHLSKLAAKNNNNKLAKNISIQLSQTMPNILGEKHPLIKLFNNEYNFQNIE